jgi:hypothetical protein
MVSRVVQRVDEGTSLYFFCPCSMADIMGLSGSIIIQDFLPTVDDD